MILRLLAKLHRFVLSDVACDHPLEAEILEEVLLEADKLIEIEFLHDFNLLVDSRVPVHGLCKDAVEALVRLDLQAVDSSAQLALEECVEELAVTFKVAQLGKVLLKEAADFVVVCDEAKR